MGINEQETEWEVLSTNQKDYQDKFTDTMKRKKVLIKTVVSDLTEGRVEIWNAVNGGLDSIQIYGIHPKIVELILAYLDRVFPNWNEIIEKIYLKEKNIT